MTDEQKKWLDTELWNFVHGCALELGLSDSAVSDDSQLYRNIRMCIETFDLVAAGESRERELERMLRKVLDSAMPNAKEHPTMFAAWAEAERLLGR